MPAAGRHITVLFVGLGVSRISWYRIVLPAMYLGCDWMGVSGLPPKLHFDSGYVKGETKLARYEDYDCIVIQQPRGRGWFTLMRQMQERGIKVLYEIDDYVHAIRKQADHDFRESFGKRELREMELCMRAADGIICSTPFLARRYQAFNRTWVCPNGLDMARYRLTRPPERPEVNGKPSVTIGWSGATGHQKGIAPWLQVIEDMMVRLEHTRFCSIGYPFAQPFKAVFGDRAMAIPFAFLDTYPSAMMHFDVALAPASRTNFHRGKSPLRAMEAQALGIPVVADRALYGPVVEDAVTGFLVDTPAEAENAIEELVRDDSLRLRMADAAKRHASQFDMRTVVEHWKVAISGALS